jgi:hypothetical protein
MNSCWLVLKAGLMPGTAAEATSLEGKRHPRQKPLDGNESTANPTLLFDYEA